tara:strand:- start:704 stop:970 length:267 start_codon:yes stop_codon:yes gene_type:complete
LRGGGLRTRGEAGLEAAELIAAPRNAWNPCDVSGNARAHEHATGAIDILPTLIAAGWEFGRFCRSAQGLRGQIDRAKQQDGRRQNGKW